ncbi:fanconi anemia group I protein [Mytilus galloprovincialis]|uniref:Fanconi anemia group I protein n=1 Tax=Mytilus galloprovincialis TaxID=29158 RepID=A0A8B6D497_MYTGA|nr:fanconi anemia group I protein [Mytilus galloprovincialis]
MDKKLVNTANEGDAQKVAELLQSISEDELVHLIQGRALRGKGDPVELVRTVLLGSSDGSSKSNKIRIQVYKLCVQLLEKNEMQNKLASDLVGLLMLQADSLTGPALVEIANVFSDLVKNGQIQSGRGLELLPKIMSSIAAEETVVYGDGSMKGTEYKSHIQNSLCACKWSSKSVLHLAAMFKDVQMSLDELKFVIDKIIRLFKDTDLQDLPALIYQLLLLSTKGHKRLVIEGIINFYVDQDKQNHGRSENELSEDLMSDATDIEVLRHTEGTVILHISFAVKQDQELGREFIKLLKSNQMRSAAQVLSPFNFALALCLARIHRFEDQIYDLIKTMILKSFKDGEKQSSSQWVREIVQDTCHVQEFALETIKNSKYGWDHVIQGLVHLGFLLMDSFGPKAIFGRIETSAVPQTGPTHLACQLGSQILLNTFKQHEMVRAEILDQIFNRVVTKATTPVSHYMDLLSSAVLSAPQILLESTPKVREMLDYLSFLSPVSAEALLMAIHPLLKLSLTLKDSLILILRKAMFSRQLDARKIGLQGFLLILKHFKVLGGLPSSQSSQQFSSSQVQVDIHARYNPASNEALCLEIMGNLRRVLSQQVDVRLILYQGLYDALCRNTQLQGPVLDLLKTQFKKYYEPSEDVNPPYKLDLCISAQGDQVFLAEPLAHLICCIQLCLTKIMDIRRQTNGDDEEEDVTRSHTELEDIMDSLVKRMIKSEMEDFELDKSADFSPNNSVGVKNKLFAILVMGTYEVLIEYIFRTGHNSDTSCREILELFGNYTKLYDILKEKSNQTGGKKGKTTSVKPPLSLMSINCVSSLLETLIMDSAPSNKENLSGLREDLGFYTHVLNIAHQKVHQIQEKGRCDGPEGKEKSKLMKYVCQLGRLFLKYYTENQKTGEEGRRGKVLTGLCLEGLTSVITIILQQFSNQLMQCLCDIADTDTQTDKQEVIYSIVKKCQRLTINILSSTEEGKHWKEVASLLNIIHQLCKQMTHTSDQYDKVTSWILKLCQEQEIDDLPTCKLMLSTLIDMTQQMKSCSPLLRELSQDIHSQLGDIDQEVEVEDRTNFALLTPRSAAPMVVLLVLNHMDRDLDDTEWVVNRLKADILAESALEDDTGVDLTQREGREKSVCTRLCVIVTAFHELVQSAIPVGSCAEVMIKVVTRLFTTITLLVKFYLSLYSSKAGHLSGRFEKLIKLIGTQLTPYVYSMITYIQTTENEQIQQTMEKGKKDKKKKTAAAKAGSAKVMKQSRTVPNLIFAIETCEKFLIQLTKKSKVNLMEHMKHSTSRDFRINVAALQEASGSEDEDEEEEEEEGDETQEQQPMEIVSDEETDENQEPPNKKVCKETDGASKKGKLSSKGKKNVKVT